MRRFGPAAGAGAAAPRAAAHSKWGARAAAPPRRPTKTTTTTKRKGSSPAAGPPPSRRLMLLGEAAEEWDVLFQVSAEQKPALTMRSAVLCWEGRECCHAAQVQLQKLDDASKGIAPRKQRELPRIRSASAPAEVARRFPPPNRGGGMAGREPAATRAQTWDATAPAKATIPLTRRQQRRRQPPQPQPQQEKVRRSSVELKR